ncbi:MAG: SLC13/DASS family transporter [Proteobacteria bacterium]|nr:SLC13/DASS family transporter [Pseudomonadota bacterium]
MNTKNLTLLLGPVSALLVYFAAINSPVAETNTALAITAAVTVLCVIWWIFEPVPIPVTSLLPLAIFQISGVLSKDQIGMSYGSPLVLLLLGGFILSKAMERSGAHLRLALFMVNLFGNSSSKSLVLGFMVTAAVLSMWISNTATALMLLPVAMAVASQAEDRQLTTPLMLGIAFAASIGGIGTPIGTPPNLVFMQVYEQQFQQNIGFIEWMSWGIPVVIFMIPASWFWLTRKLTYRGCFKMPDVGCWSTIEKRVMLVFALTALAWMSRKGPFGGWSSWLGLPDANDASVALIAVVLMFIIPAGDGSQNAAAKDPGRGEALLDWKSASTIPWGILLLFGGGICLAKAFGVSGLSETLAQNLSGLSSLPVWLMIFTICISVTFLTETTSNTASTVLLMPVLAATAMGSGIEPTILMVPATISASCAFMMPIATPPNSIVYGSGFFTTRIMAKEGFVLNVTGAIIISVLCYLILV